MASRASPDELIQALKRNPERLRGMMQKLQANYILPIFENTKAKITTENEHITHFPMRMFEAHDFDTEKKKYDMMKEECHRKQETLRTAGIREKSKLRKDIKELEKKLREFRPRYQQVNNVLDGSEYQNTIPQYELLKENRLLAEESHYIKDKKRRFQRRCADQLALLLDLLADPDAERALQQSILIAFGWANNGEEDLYLESPDVSMRSDVSTLSNYEEDTRKREDAQKREDARERDFTRGGYFSGQYTRVDDDESDDDFRYEGDWENIIAFLQVCRSLLEENDPVKFMDLLHSDNAKLLVNVGIDYAKDYSVAMLREFPLILELSGLPTSVIDQFMQTNRAQENSIDLNRSKTRLNAARRLRQHNKVEYWC